MNKSTVLLTTTKVLLVQALSSSSISYEGTFCSLKWKCGILWVRRAESQNKLAALENLQWLKQCLKNSSVNLVCVDSNLGATEIKLWADSCNEVKKKIFIRLDFESKRGRRYTYFNSIIKSVFDKTIAVFFLLLASPIFLLFVLLYFRSKSSIFSRDWRVGKGGKLFQILTFRLISEDFKFQDYLKQDYELLNMHTQNYSVKSKNLDRWIKQNSLDKLPQLINVLWGEMSIVGPQALTLYDMEQTNSKHRYYIRCLPGIFYPCSVKTNQSLFQYQSK